MLKAIRRRRQRRRERRWGEQGDIEHLSDFARTRRAVEGYVEPRTMITETTVVLVADTGEWTRRRIAGPEAAWEMGAHLGIPTYDVTKVGYPDRMRAWTRRQSAQRRDRERAPTRGKPETSEHPDRRDTE